MNGYTRAAPAIECDSRETLDLMRETVSTYTDDKVSESQNILKSARLFSIVTMAILIGGMIGIFISARKWCGHGLFALCFTGVCAWICPAIWTLISLGFSLGTVSVAGNAKSLSEEDKQLIEDLYGNADCGDPLSSGISSIMYEQVKDRSDARIAGASTLALFGIFAIL